MKRTTLLSALAPLSPLPKGEDDICGIACDSREVEPGFAFVCVSGHAHDGHDYVSEAVARGARLIIAERVIHWDDEDAAVPVVRVGDGRAALADLAGMFYGHPASRVRAVGITGTKGKTTTTILLRAILRVAGKECGVLGTLGEQVFGRMRSTRNTTPDPITIQRFLSELDRPRGGYAAIEVSSHALDQDRVRGVPFSVAVFTNLSGEHLDYHLTMGAYLEAKARLFDELGEGATAVIHMAHAEPAARLARYTRARIVGYGIGSGFEVAARDLCSTSQGTRFVLSIGEAPGEAVHLRLLGRHNVENALAAAGAAHALGVTPECIRRGLESVLGVPGRLEPVEAGQPFRVLVDYAHTDDALEKVLTALRPLVGDGRIVCLFGCGGDRDRGKRPRMGRVAERLADVLVLTSDNPRTEDPEAIIDEVRAGLSAPERVHVWTDRKRGIACALLEARPGDIVLIAGKGHETYQVIGTERLPFDDREVARHLLERVAPIRVPFHGTRRERVRRAGRTHDALLDA
ncbi:MAG: UDP-N-acetylmuramoyl-L-alanyl-D-glutamate--2,6-diaminopimelate ligase [Planctomycetota bacterium]|jgi:UDP-N-acetylmuramoyl-L-alanyl-D-glutamate--2,6-diaminopimelate ligase